jgi:hypothetical protein
MISWLQKHMLPCAFKMLFGIDCPVCGFQRSLVALLRADFIESFKIYPPLIFVLALIVLSILYLIFPGVIKSKYLRFYGSFVLAIITLNYIVKILTGSISA